jgi:hypothetical protein
MGAGVSGIYTIKSLLAQGIPPTDIHLLEGRKSTLGGRLHKQEFPPNSQTYIEAGGNWIFGTGGKTPNPVSILADKHGLRRTRSNYSSVVYREDGVGLGDQRAFRERVEYFKGVVERVYRKGKVQYDQHLMDRTLRSVCKFLFFHYVLFLLLSRGSMWIVSQEGWNPKTAMDLSIEYNIVDFEDGESPDVEEIQHKSDVYSEDNYGDVSTPL